MNNLKPNKTKSLGAKRQYIYMITIRKHQVKDFVSVSELRDTLDYLIIEQLGWSTCCISNVVYEIDPIYSQLHLHCIMHAKRNFKYSRYTRAGPFRIHFRRVYDLGGMERYLTKQIPDKYRQEQLIIENHYNYHYGFEV